MPSLFSSSPSASNASYITPEPGNINAISLGDKTITGGREVWALVDTRIQRWDMKSEGWEQLLLDEEVASIVRTAVREAFGQGVEQDNARMDLELVDLAIDMCVFQIHSISLPFDVHCDLKLTACLIPIQ
jgi:nuclear pore complex protein Nup133